MQHQHFLHNSDNNQSPATGFFSRVKQQVKSKIHKAGKLSNQFLSILESESEKAFESLIVEGDKFIEDLTIGNIKVANRDLYYLSDEERDYDELKTDFEKYMFKKTSEPVQKELEKAKGEQKKDLKEGKIYSDLHYITQAMCRVVLEYPRNLQHNTPEEYMRKIEEVLGSDFASKISNEIDTYFDGVTLSLKLRVNIMHLVATYTGRGKREFRHSFRYVKHRKISQDA